jgi:hypothetical protein
LKKKKRHQNQASSKEDKKVASNEKLSSLSSSLPKKIYQVCCAHPDMHPFSKTSIHLPIQSIRHHPLTRQRHITIATLFFDTAIDNPMQRSHDNP